MGPPRRLISGRRSRRREGELLWRLGLPVDHCGWLRPRPGNARGLGRVRRANLAGGRSSHVAGMLRVWVKVGRLMLGPAHMSVHWIGTLCTAPVTQMPGLMALSVRPPTFMLPLILATERQTL